MSIARLLFAFAKSQVGAQIIGWSFAHMSQFIPVQRLHETDFVLAFYHPKPSHSTHILIVPKEQVGSILVMDEQHLPILRDVVAVTKYLVQKLGLEERGFRLIVNGGAYQDVQQVHWHLISDGKAE